MSAAKDDAPAGLVYGCLTHVPLWVDYPAWVLPIRLGTAQADDGGSNLRDLAPEWEPHHPILGGLAGTFALKNFIVAQQPSATQVGVCQYRKFVANARLGGTVAPSYKVMDLIADAALSTARLAAAMRPDGREFMVSRPFTLSNWRKRDDYLAQYSRVHHAQDLLRFTAEAVEQGVLDKAEVHDFLGADWIVPGGIDLGVYPAAFWLRSVTAIENITRVCVQRYPQHREGYDARAWAFCAERLGGYLLLAHWARGSHSRSTHVGRSTARWPARDIGQLHLITQGSASDYVIGA